MIGAHLPLKTKLESKCYVAKTNSSHTLICARVIIEQKVSSGSCVSSSLGSSLYEELDPINYDDHYYVEESEVL